MHGGIPSEPSLEERGLRDGVGKLYDSCYRRGSLSKWAALRCQSLNWYRRPKNDTALPSRWRLTGGVRPN